MFEYKRTEQYNRHNEVAFIQRLDFKITYFYGD